jgi:hypothetical protein
MLASNLYFYIHKNFRKISGVYKRTGIMARDPSPLNNTSKILLALLPEEQVTNETKQRGKMRVETSIQLLPLTFSSHASLARDRSGALPELRQAGASQTCHASTTKCKKKIRWSMAQQFLIRSRAMLVCVMRQACNLMPASVSAHHTPVLANVSRVGGWPVISNSVLHNQL